MYRTLSLTPEVVIERNRPGEEGKEDEGRGMGREADSFSVGKQQEFMCEGEIPRTHAVLLWQSLFWKGLETENLFPER